jgi:hypothetical protein
VDRGECCVGGVTLWLGMDWEVHDRRCGMRGGVCSELVIELVCFGTSGWKFIIRWFCVMLWLGAMSYGSCFSMIFILILICCSYGMFAPFPRASSGIIATA